MHQVNTSFPGQPVAQAQPPAQVAQPAAAGLKATRRFEPQVPHELTNKALMLKISEAVNSNRDQEISTLLNDNKIVARLEMCLTFYKTQEGGDQNALELAISQLQLKFAKKEIISDNMKEMVLKPFAIECGLDAESAFNLLDTFFMTDFQHFSYFENIDKRIKEFQGQVQHQLQAQGALMLQQQQQRQEQYDAYHNELTKKAKQIVAGAKNFYLQERKSLLRAITCLLRLMARQPSNSAVRDKLIRKEMPSNLAKSLLRCQRGEALEFRHFFDSDNSLASRERLAFALQEEQIELLSLLFSLQYSDQDILTNSKDGQSIVASLSQYLLQSCQQSQQQYQTAYSLRHLALYSENQSTISGLTQLVYMSMLQLHKTFKGAPGRNKPVVNPQVQHAWNLLMNPENLSQATGPAMLAIVQEAEEAKINDGSLNKMKDALRNHPDYLVALTELLQSQAFLCETLEQLSDAFYIVIYGWLVKAYRFYTNHGMDVEVKQVQSLALSVLSNPAIVRNLWQNIDTNGSITMIGAEIEIFRPYLEEPTRDVNTFLNLCLVLAGKRNERRGTSIVTMLRNTKVRDEAAGEMEVGDSNLLIELIALVSTQITSMEQQTMNEDEYVMVERVLTLFAKVIKQDASQYPHLNNMYMIAAEKEQDGLLAHVFQKAARRGRSASRIVQHNQLRFERGNHPFLSLLVRALHALAPINFQHSRKVIYHILEAMTALYDHDDLLLKKDIIQELAQQQDYDYGDSQIVTFFSSTVLAQEESCKNFKVTASFLRLLTKVYKRPYPLGCLGSPDQRMALDNSLICSALEKIYLSCMAGYFNMQFHDAASIASFTTRALKLTRVLLELFLEVPQSQKAPLNEPMPRYDKLLEKISVILNQFQIEQICTKVLELVNVEERRPNGSFSSSFENKILNEAKSQRKAHPSTLRNLGKMCSEAILVQNTIMKLALVDDAPQNDGSQVHTNSQYERSNVGVQDWTSKRCYYIQNLRCVQSFRSLVLDPQRSLQSVTTSSATGSDHKRNFLYGQSSTISIQSQLAYYASPINAMANIKVRTAALDHLTLTCQLWQSFLVESVRPDLLQMLNGLGSSQQVHNLLFKELEVAFSGTMASLPQCLAYLDLLIVAAQTQPSFVELLFKTDKNGQKALDQLSTSILRLLDGNRPQGAMGESNILQSEQRLHIKLKLTALLSQMAKKRLCIDFLTQNEGNLISSLYKNVIEQECLGRLMTTSVALNGSYLTPVVPMDADFEVNLHDFGTKTRLVRNQCTAKVVLCLFLQLLVSEFSRNPQMVWLRRLITSIFSNERFKDISLQAGQISSEVYQLLTYVRNLNDRLQLYHEERDCNSQRQLNDALLAQNANLAENQSHSPLYSSKGSVYLQGTLCIDLFKVMERNRTLSSFMVAPGANLIDLRGSLGSLGPSFYVSTKEIDYSLKQECYKNQSFIGQAFSVYSEFNLALSVMLTDHFVLKAKHDFMVSIGKISLRDAQASAKTERLIPQSLFPLIDAEHATTSAERQSDQRFPQSSQRLNKIMIEQAKAILKEIATRRRSLQQHEQAAVNDNSTPPQNYFMGRLDQDLLQLLVFTLGAISCQVSAAEQPLSRDIYTDLQGLIQQQILTRIDSLLEINHTIFDQGFIAQEVQNGSNLSQQTTRTIQSGERHKYEIFIQLVTQCFQLCIRLKEQEQRDDRNLPTSNLENTRVEDAYILVLSKVLDGMRLNFCFLQGLKVFVLAVQLIDSDGRNGGLSQLMRSKGDQPIKIIIGKLLERDATPDEVTTILQLLINYAATSTGAIHLSQCSILASLFSSNIMQHLNEQDLYVSHQIKNQSGQTSQQQVRNPVHIHWCQVLLLMITLNESLLDNPQIEHQQYFADLLQQMHHYKQRVPKVLHIGLTMETQATRQADHLGNRSILSLALIEEIELISAVLQQIFQHADLWAQFNFATYCDMKDYMLFALSKLLQHCDNRAVIPASTTEQHLQKMTRTIIEERKTNLQPGAGANPAIGNDQQTNAFELKIEVSLHKTFLNLTSSLLNCLLLSDQLVKQGKLSKTSGSDLIVTWQSNSPHQFTRGAPSQSMMHQGNASYVQRPANSGVFTEAWLANAQVEGIPIVLAALEAVRACQDSMSKRMAALKSLASQGHVQSLFKYMRSLFLHDEWILREYSGGFNTHTLADIDNVDDIISMSETSLQVSAQVSAMLLLKLREHSGREMGYDHENQLGDERQVANMAFEILTYMREVQRDCTAEQQLDKNYLDKLRSFVEIIKEEPHNARNPYYQGSTRF